MGAPKIVMTELCLSPTDYFNEVVQEGLAKRNLQAPPEASQYLVQLLQHYLDARNLHDQPVNELGQRLPQTFAEMYLWAGQCETAERIEWLRRVGDRTLYLCGFFGDSFSRKLVDVDYYVDLGGAAYRDLSSCVRQEPTSKVYKLFSERFVEFVDVFAYISHKSFINTDESVLRLYEKYMKTGSQHAKQRLADLGVFPAVDVNKKHTRQEN